MNAYKKILKTVVLLPIVTEVMAKRLSENYNQEQNEFVMFRQKHTLEAEFDTGIIFKRKFTMIWIEDENVIRSYLEKIKFKELREILFRNYQHFRDLTDTSREYFELNVLPKIQALPYDCLKFRPECSQDFTQDKEIRVHLH